MQVFTVQGMTCGHCAKAITRAVREHDDEAVVEIDLARKQVKVQSDLPADNILKAIRAEGYGAEPA
ncbi:heavy-metal-associated domain-containing protein [Pseudomonas sp. NPDC087612]|uniref:Copper resistance protein CopZ n=1 Tax=Pseudomonas vranovensis TaxID=321661 RepID=A0A423DYS1_9PSED|nr:MULTISPECIES: heavy metal-associated domain-containing protein [Pseudomonas]KJK17961.1 copper resistance protein CopZ [Pseudomonas sp. 2(2015)]NLU59352.1 heavy-metal-associated domain-containing protein [Pseudomonas sp. BIGb0427]QPG65101.1 heavy-metal-associated domain-containing protein [Pseudomonas sp. BIGb0427]QVM96153.1 heavy-metal-associated domain-containing protein [Pseudomonas sp. SORT22]ROL77582.1 copper resistance protein CopZ [Pseudomonas vranovensis]